jgi:hypothetical protein
MCRMCKKRMSMKRSSRSRKRWMFVVSSLVFVVVVGVSDVVRKTESYVRPLIEVGRIGRTL